MAAVVVIPGLYRRVYDSRHLQADRKEPGSAPEPHAGQSSMGFSFTVTPR